MINEHKIKLTGTANIAQELDNQSVWDLVIKNAEVRKKSFDPNDDGTENLTHTITISELSEVNLINQTGIIPAKKKGSQAKALRFVLEQEADELGVDREQHYQQRMTEIINDIKNGN
jgi:hypothetical protein